MIKIIKEYLKYCRLKKELEVADKRLRYYTGEIVHYGHHYSDSEINELVKMQSFWKDTHRNLVEGLIK